MVWSKTGMASRASSVGSATYDYRRTYFLSLVWVLYLFLFLSGCCVFETAFHITHASLKLMA